MAPDSNSPMFRITSLLGPVAWGASWAMVSPFCSVPSQVGKPSCPWLDGGIKLDYSFVYE
jgi:hypothetical protein